MTYKPTSALPVAIAFALWSTAAHADRFTDAVIERYQELGFDYIEVKEGISQLKVEAIRGNQKYEVIYDRESGRILKQETERAEANEIGRSGVDIDTRRRDFLDSDDIDDDENDSDESDESDDDENDSDESDESDESDDDENDSDESDESDDDENDSDESDESDDGESDSDESDDDESSNSGSSNSGSGGGGDSDESDDEDD